MERKHSIITFKADEFMMAALENIPNKSEFIRSAILAALDETCPFCSGTGTLNPHQKIHWSHFLEEHHLTHCKECNGVEVRCIHHEHDHEKENNSTAEDGNTGSTCCGNREQKHE